jgi:hypothetical protein
VGFDRIGIRSLPRLDGEKLALVVPLVERVGAVEAFMTLQADQFRAVDSSQGFRDFRLADARLSFQQKRASEHVHERERRCKAGVGDVADLGEASGNAAAVRDGHEKRILSPGP